MAWALAGAGLASRSASAATPERRTLRLMDGEDADAAALRVLLGVHLDRELTAAHRREGELDDLPGRDLRGRQLLVIAVDVKDAVDLRRRDQRDLAITAHGGVRWLEAVGGERQLDPRRQRLAVGGAADAATHHDDRQPEQGREARACPHRPGRAWRLTSMVAAASSIREPMAAAVGNVGAEAAVSGAGVP